MYAPAQVHPQRAFWDSLRQATRMSLLDTTAGGVVIYPSFPAGADAREGLPRGVNDACTTNVSAWGRRQLC